MSALDNDSMLMLKTVQFICVGMDNKAVAEKSFIAQLYEHIEAAGNQGVTQQVRKTDYVAL
jgi:hypothetical protein